MVRVKICGITNHRDARMSVEMGADAIGFIFAPSSRQITPEKAREIICGIPPFVQTVGVFVNERPDTIREIIESCSLDLIQLHGDETPDTCAEFMPQAIKAFRFREGSVLQSIRPYRRKIRAMLFDSYDEKIRGGTGKTCNWDLALRGKDFGIPIILSGGLTPSNIERAISSVKPFAVDVNSGVEKRPGKKDHLLMRELMEKIRKANHGGLTDA
ncbi:MAG: phosphoribosylanthranilate isomerase [Desulfobacteraceae bacterium]|uniref:N-(5'-phosphoribosyl)anthranilate isomerase n=1 Tax=Candidatus Desulfacyla euxinica TaxID=2841693 RepID=A0A8J6N1E9_9DELT|nr:phosphoribosylanthranilate isomerase [Candidatus Desulfacyla euxinica]MBL6978215.1 phosphoribosylanthranilate isomerase [Desulfobacteraceae bacterium]MBL7216294.1 phosphoribosylanthranilate isomerase [Desulfobacteraceae bacterium]